MCFISLNLEVCRSYTTFIKLNLTKKKTKKKKQKTKQNKKVFILYKSESHASYALSLSQTEVWF